MSPDLRIIEDDLWRAVRARKAVLAHGPRQGGNGRPRLVGTQRPRHLFSGLIRCGSCGASYIIYNNGRMACAGHRDKGICDNSRTVPMTELERRVLNGLRRKLLAPELIAVFVEEYHAEWTRLAQADRERRAGLVREIFRVEQRIRTLMDMAGHGAFATREARRQFAADLDELAPRKEALAAELAALEARAKNVVDLHPRAVAAYKARVEDLAAALSQFGAAAEVPAAERLARADLTQTLRSMVSHIEVFSADGRGQVEIRAHGYIAEVIDYVTRNKSGAPLSMPVVAGEGLEPPTLGF